jgi:riboflavin biosynthesis pyrimidine reductase
MDGVLQLYPLPAGEMVLEGLYLGHNLRARLAERDEPFVYTNFVVSLDGRIAVPRADGNGMTVPSAIANERDWRLFQELAVQADVILSSGRYLRDYAEGNAQELLEVYENPAFADLKQWRLDQGLPQYPDFAVISRSLDFPIPEALTKGARNVIIATTADADPKRKAELEKQGARVIIAGETGVQGRPLVDGLAALGYGMIYNATGPLVHHLLLADDVLDRLYLTHANRLLGGKPFDSVVTGSLLENAVGMRIDTVYLDASGLNGLGQMFVAYDRVRSQED